MEGTSISMIKMLGVQDLKKKKNYDENMTLEHLNSVFVFIFYF